MISLRRMYVRTGLDRAADLWHLDTREVPLTGLRVADGHGEREREVADIGERVSRIDRQGGQDREDLVDEHPPQLEVPFGSLVVAHDADALLGQRLAHLVEGEGVLADRSAPCGEPRNVSAAPRPSAPSFQVARLDLLLEAGRGPGRTRRGCSKVDEKRMRSRSGLRGSVASYRTRALKSSQESSRLMNGTAAGATGCARRRVAGGRTAVMGGGVWPRGRLCVSCAGASS
jgi:hypothetical protein